MGSLFSFESVSSKISSFEKIIMILMKSFFIVHLLRLKF